MDVFKFNLSLKLADHNRLENLRSRQNITKTEIIRRALHLYELGLNAQEQDQNLSICDCNGTVVTKINII